MGRQPQDRLYLNDGAGRFTDATLERIGVEAETMADVKFVDLDGDADLDIVRVNLGPLQALLNNGTGHFTDATGTVFPEAIVGPGVGIEVFDATATVGSTSTSRSSPGRHTPEPVSTGSSSGRQRVDEPRQLLSPRCWGPRETGTTAVARAETHLDVLCGGGGRMPKSSAAALTQE